MKPTLEELIGLIGNSKAYAVQHEDGSWHPVRERVTKGVLRAHLRGDITIGTYIVTSKGNARTLVFDLDSGEAAEEEAIKVNEALRKLGVPSRSIGTEDSGRKGIHVWVLPPGLVPAADLRRLGAATLVLAGLKCEVFPKQDQARDLGNLVKLPGGVHRVSGRPNDFIGPVPEPMTHEEWLAALNDLPETRMRSGGEAPAPFKCLECAQAGVGEGCRNIMLFQLATMCRGRGLNDESTEAVVRLANEKCDPPLDEAELNALLESSRNSGPICTQVPEEMHCGDQCVVGRTSLYTRPKQVRYAAPNELVVVRVKKRRGTVIEFEHEDLDQAKGVLKDGDD